MQERVVPCTVQAYDSSKSFYVKCELFNVYKVDALIV